MAQKAAAKKTTAAKAARKEEVQPATPIQVDSTTARDDSDARVGHFARVIAGEHEGKYGVVTSFSEFDAKTGYPTTAVVLTRDDNHETIAVEYEDLVPDVAGKR